ncbi:hypothetical protein ABZ896_03405 [Streptomyces sp. NPDC047072]
MDDSSRRHLRSLTRKASHGIVRSAACVLVANATGWNNYWINQR